ncbi:MAG: crossover junction endodeoxyribonuclease RuvC, partial [Planctomycetes bacterium]|nr:crossover junction endodeoxyribonuclease RuvC [Planctomycetota bacterium]
MALRVLGVDPGTRVVGFGLLDDLAGRPALVACGAIRVPASLPVAERLRDIFRALTRIIRRHRPTALAIEEAFFSRNPQAAFRIGEGRAVALLAAALAGLPVHQYAPRSVKQAVVGRGGAGKAQVARMVAARLALAAPPTPEDVTDALAIALCHLQRARTT